MGAPARHFPLAPGDPRMEGQVWHYYAGAARSPRADLVERLAPEQLRAGNGELVRDDLI